MTLLGRDRELALLDARLAAVRAGRPFALVRPRGAGHRQDGAAHRGRPPRRRLHGPRDPRHRGRGAAAVSRAARARRAAARSPAHTLPPAQALALGTALDLEPPTPHDRFAVPAALLGLLQAAAQRGPVLVVADDAQWLDGASRDALRFVARRLPDAPIGIIAAGRAASTPADGLRRARPRRARRAAAGPWARPRAAAARRARRARRRRRGAARRGGRQPARAARDPAPAEPRGARRPHAAHRAAGARASELEAAFAREVGTLPDATRRALTVAAAMESGPVRLLLDALAAVGLDEATLAPAERDRHAHARRRRARLPPSARPRGRLPRGERGRSAAPPTRRWPRSSATSACAPGTSPPPPIARTPPSRPSSRPPRARRGRGADPSRRAPPSRAPPSSAPRRRERGRLRLEAAQDLAVAGRLDRAAALLDDAEREAGPEHRLAILRLRGNLDVRRGNPTAAHDRLIAEAERQLAAGEPRLACDLALEAIVAGTMIADGPAQRRTVDLAVRAGRLVGGGHELLADSVAAEFLVVEGRAAEAHARKEALDERLALMDPIVGQELLGLVAQGWVWLGDLDRAERVVDRLLAAYEEAGALGRAPYPLNVRAQIAFRRGRWEQALADAADSVAARARHRRRTRSSPSTSRRWAAWRPRSDATPRLTRTSTRPPRSSSARARSATPRTPRRRSASPRSARAGRSGRSRRSSGPRSSSGAAACTTRPC